MSQKRGKKYLEKIEKYKKDDFYEPEEAIGLAKELHWTKFEETIDIAMKLGIDTRKAEEQVRGAVDLPHGTGRKVKVVVFAQGEKAKEAEEAGMDRNKTAVFYCGSGMRASVNYLVARHLGYPALLYDGSYQEWERLDLPLTSPVIDPSNRD